MESACENKEFEWPFESISSILSAAAVAINDVGLPFRIETNAGYQEVFCGGFYLKLR